MNQYVPKDCFISNNMPVFSRNIKRIYDFQWSLVVQILFFPHRFYLQYRHLQAGTYRQVLYKFRSMCLDAEISDPQLSHSNSNNDSRLTKVGHFIRAYHLVKLPQLYNALRGYMALIEPHPERKFYIDQIMEHDYSILISIRSAWA